MGKPRVCVIGCAGKMGQVICRGLLASQDFQLVAGVDVARVGDDLGQVVNVGHVGIAVTSNLQTTLAEARVDIAIDFTTPTAVTNNVAQCLQEKVSVLVGTTGLSPEDIEKLQHLAAKTGTAVLIVPNFAIGALLMMEFCQKAARYMPHVEIIELHHPQKLDKPSGTARRTRECMMQAMGRTDLENPEQVPIHSVRLPGLVAHQEVIFGDVGQVLTIRHDSFQRESFMPGVLLGLKQLGKTKGLKIGLEL
ncbi:MAG: 4-hydroxy-tetrahydrodipicolinate reductase [Candidatus Ozemobacter sibiricus]|uniref:4-hydroxy-tetrahydrodipicolinate reductase n=1 Tax=Candidatus Ozemobacter sibiricus TaxID=2268124 RepID=A0A367ZMQ1_9BACT|nr:MAG: 4-hydroxy-tetrahydrodipicolinate reductase [Candidatus Ozemobacter sibiricus]